MRSVCTWGVFVAVLASCILCTVARHPGGHHERESDGAYSPRDKHHYEGGHHDDQFDHESILGSHKEAKEFDHLPPEEAKQRLGELAKLMDLDHDGYVTRDELQKWIIKSFTRLAKEESDERFTDTDSNKDGLVSWKEVLSESYDVEDESAIPADDTDELQLVREDRSVFKAADTDSDDHLTRDEYLAFSHPEEVDRMAAVLVDNSLLEKDKDKDGVIDFKEFIAGGTDDETEMEGDKDRFNDHDKNRDGHLDREEIRKWIQPSNQDISKEETDHLFSSADDDHDDKLSIKEIVDHHDVFVGSEATDYGDHLHNLDDLHEEL